MRIPRKVVKYLQGLPDWLVILGVFAVWGAFMVGLIYVLTFIGGVF